MTLPPSSRFQLAPDLNICRLLTGLWQVSGAHGTLNPQAALADMQAYHAAGFTTWDLADHYGPAEDWVGQFRQELQKKQGATALSASQAFTKWVPRPGRMTRQVVAEAVQTSLQRMATAALDLLQFHWWKYNDPNYLEALVYLAQLREAGQIRHLGLTNFDTAHTQLLVERGFRLVVNQVQFSLIDMRPLVALVPFCLAHGIHLLTYGTLCGGFLAESYLGQPEPQLNALATASQWKYKRMIDVWGGWGLFQQLLQALNTIATKHEVSIANVAVRYILDQPSVAGVIIGARLGKREHRADNARVFELTLDAADLAAIQTVQAQARDLFRSIGDCGTEYRQ